MKPCTYCGQTKPLDQFHVNVKGRHGRQARCKACTNILYYQPRKEQVLAQTRARRSTEDGRAQEREWQRARRRSYPLVRIVQEAKVRASKRGLDFNITADDLSMPLVCPVLGIPISMAKGPRADGSPSIDRVDTSRGYVVGNVQIISWRANRIKSDATADELRAILRYMERAALGVAATVRGITR